MVDKAKVSVVMDSPDRGQQGAPSFFLKQRTVCRKPRQAGDEDSVATEGDWRADATMSALLGDPSLYSMFPRDFCTRSSYLSSRCFLA